MGSLIITILVVAFLLFVMPKIMRNYDDQELAPDEQQKKYKRYCPKCGSGNCHAFVDNMQISGGKVTATYSANLNPFKPFTFVNKKEKVTQIPVYMNVTKFQCDDCGKIFR